MKQKQPIVSRTKQHTFEELVQSQKLERLAKLAPDLVGRYGFTASCASSFANLIKEAYGGKNLNVVYASRMLALWNIACSCYHKADGYSLADELFSDKKIFLDSFYYHNNTSDIITLDMIEDVRKNCLHLVTTATSDSISVIEFEMEKESDLYYFIKATLGSSFSRMHYSVLVKALAGALAKNI
ncbi:TPA: hypothetical protein ACJ84X_001844 [Streptococcus pneumoniae]